MNLSRGFIESLEESYKIRSSGDLRPTPIFTKDERRFLRLMTKKNGANTLYRSRSARRIFKGNKLNK